MIQDIVPHRYDNTYKIQTPHAQDILLYYQKQDVLCQHTEQRLLRSAVDNRGGLLEVREAVDIALVYSVRSILVTLAGKQVLADKKLLFDDLIKYVYLHSG